MKKWKVLVADDEEKIRSLLELYLIKNNYLVVTAKNGREVLELTESEKPDLILLDILMPDIDGFEVCRRIRSSEEHRDIPILYLSSLHEPDTIIEGLNLGADDYIVKPFDPNILIAKINAILRRLKGKEICDQKVKEELFEKLTYQEKNILTLIEQGYTNKEIAEKLKLTEGTVKVYNHTLFQKLQVKNRTQAIVKAKEIDLLV